jgi:hypothetical protein
MALFPRVCDTCLAATAVAAPSSSLPIVTRLGLAGLYR